MAAIDLYLVAGQSNAEGRGNSAESPSVDPEYGYEYVSGSTVLSLADPVGGASTGSAWPAFANSMIAKRDRALCITEAAHTGTSLLASSDTGNGNWSTEGTRFAGAVTLATNALNNLVDDGWTPTLRAVLWHQGETDGTWSELSAAALEAAYAPALIELRDRFETALGVEDLCVFQVGRPNAGDTAKYAAVRAAQATACEEDGLHLVYTDCVNFPGWGMMTDDAHYNQTGLNLMGTEGAEACARVLYGWPRYQSRVPGSGGSVLAVGGALSAVH